MTMTKKIKKLTKAQALQRINRHLDYWGNRLGLAQEWDIKIELVANISGDGAKADEAAQVNWSAGYRNATMQFSPELQTCSDKDAEFYVLHELGHLWYAPVSDRIATLVGRDSGVGEDLAVAEETVIDRWTLLLLRS